jgi:hypothetical protein
MISGQFRIRSFHHLVVSIVARYRIFMRAWSLGKTALALVTFLKALW